MEAMRPIPSSGEQLPAIRLGTWQTFDVGAGNEERQPLAAVVTWAQLLLKFVVSHPAVTCVIPATSDAGHLRQNREAGAGPLPDAGQRARIAAAADC
jgi:aryl-alcohol dehydrogenase-like predicted oxidoreductase